MLYKIYIAYGVEFKFLFTFDIRLIKLAMLVSKFCPLIRAFSFPCPCYVLIQSLCISPKYTSLAFLEILYLVT